MSDVQTVAIIDVHPNAYNPNVVPEHVMAALEANVDRAGFNQPVLVRPHPTLDGAFEIVDGEHRWRVAQKRGDKTIPVVIRDMSDAEAKAQTVAMNKLRGEMEPADVARLLREAQDDGIDLDELGTFTGYTPDELHALDSLLDFDWDTAFADDGTATSEPTSGDDEWVTLTWRVPEDVAHIVNSELDRLRTFLNTEHDHLALELMAVTSAQTQESQLEGDQE